MIKVYYEFKGYADLVATFTNDEAYNECVPALERHAKANGYDRVTETSD